jgi:hypothetical protein
MFDQRYGRGVPRLYWDGGDVGGVDEAGIGVSEDGSADAGTGTGSGSSGGSGGGSSGGSGGSAGGMYNVDPFFDPSIGQMYNVDPSIDIDPNIDPSIALMANTTPQNTVAAPVETTSPHYGDPVNVFGIEVRGLTDAGQAYQDEQDALEGMNSGDTQHSDGAAFPSMYDPAPPVVEQPVIDPITQPGPTTSPEDSILFHFTPQERHSYLLNQIEMGMEPTRGYTGPDGVFVDLTTVYPDIFSAPSDYVTFPDIGGGSAQFPKDLEFRLPGNEGFELPPGTRDPKTGRIYSRDTSWLIPPPAGSLNTMVMEPHIHPITGEIAYANSGGWTIDPEIYNQLKTEGDGVMPRITLGDPGGYEFDPVTGDYIDGGGGYKYGGYVDDYRMNRGGIMDLREPHLYNRGGNVMRNIHEEQARVAARERNAREEMGRLRGEARYENTQTFNQGGVASLAPVARDMFRKRRLPRAGMVV